MYKRQTTRCEDLPCVTQGSLGAGNVCEASRVWTTEGSACDAGPEAELVYRLNPLVTTLPPVPGMLRFPEVLSQAEATRNATSSSSAFRNRLALSGIAEYAVTVTLASGLLRQSNGCVRLPTTAEFAGFATASTGTAQREVAAGEGAQQTAEIGGASKPVTEAPPSASIEPPASAADGAGVPGSASAGAGASSSENPQQGRRRFHQSLLGVSLLDSPAPALALPGAPAPSAALAGGSIEALGGSSVTGLVAPLISAVCSAPCSAATSR